MGIVEMDNSPMYTKFHPPVPCKIMGHSMIPDGWTGVVEGIDHCSFREVGTCVRFDKPVPNCSTVMVWMLSPDVIITDG